MTGLSMLAAKEAIVSTFNCEALRASPSEVLAAYDWHAATFVEPAPLAEFRQSFIQAVLGSRTPKACLVAPFGYGKTASAIGIWRACQAAGLLAIPPISCGSFAELARAVSDWLAFALPNCRQQVASAHDDFLVGSAESLARKDERQFGIPYEQGLAAIADKLARGYLDFEDVTINLVSFIERATALALQEGYSGLVVSVDELQQLLGNANKGVLVALRQLIWGLRTRQLPFGLLITMDPDTERILADRAGDILHRIKDDGLHIDLRHLYDREFPARLWEQYSSALHLTDYEHRAIDRPTLEALGQLCERDDLSNGPRTVINVLQVAASSRQSTSGDSYSPIRLVDDLTSRVIHFDGDRGILPSVVGELLSFPYFHRPPERAQVLKLIAAFPRGCPEHVAAEYGLDNTWRDLRDDLRGEILTELEEGLALIEIQRVGRPANRLNMLLRRYWMQVTDQQLFSEDAPRIFTEFVLPLLFTPRVHDLSGWARPIDVQLTADGTYEGVLEGTSSPQYPLRRLHLSVASLASPGFGDRLEMDVDYRIRVRLLPDQSSVSCVKVNQHLDSIDLELALGRPSDCGLRGGLNWIEHYLSPQPISPAVVLSLLSYLASSMAGDSTQQEDARLQDTISRLREWLLAELFSPSMFASGGFEVLQAGRNGFHEFLYLLSSRRWPTYSAICTHQHWSALMDDYKDALGQIPPAAQVGIAPVNGKKDEMARLFGLARHAGFDSHAKQYGDLLKLELWNGHDASLRFMPHPSELNLATDVRQVGSLAVGEAYRQLRRAGFAAAESRVLLGLAAARGLVLREGDGLAPPAAPSAAELSAKTTSLRSRGKALTIGDNLLLTELDVVAAKLSEPSADPIEISWRLDRLADGIGRAEDEANAALRSRQAKVRADLVDAVSRLLPLPNGCDFGELENHLIAVRRILEEERCRLAKLTHQTLDLWPASAIEDAIRLVRELAAWTDRCSLFTRWSAAAEQLSSLRRSLLRLEAERGVLAQLLQRVETTTRDAREVLAGSGYSAMREVGRTEAAVLDIRTDFEAAAGEREVAYRVIADRLTTELSALIRCAVAVRVLPYDPADDQVSFNTLSDAIALAASRSLAMSILQISGEADTTESKLSRAKLRSDLRLLARRASDPGWLLSGPPLRLSTDARKAIGAIQRRVDRDAARSCSSSRATVIQQLVRVLSALPEGSAEVSSILDSIGGSITLSELIGELTHLQEAGAIRLAVQLIDPHEVENRPQTNG